MADRSGARACDRARRSRSFANRPGSAVWQAQQRLRRHGFAEHRTAVAGRGECRSDVAAEEQDIGRLRRGCDIARIGDERAAVAIVLEREVSSFVGAGEVQLNRIAGAVADRQRSASVVAAVALVRAREVDADEIDGLRRVPPMLPLRVASATVPGVRSDVMALFALLVSVSLPLPVNV